MRAARARGSASPARGRRAASPSPEVALRELERLKHTFGAEPAARRYELLKRLERARLPRAEQVERLHELLCFARAYPDSAQVVAIVERLMAGFAARGDLRRHRAALESSGIAGTDTAFRFFEPTAAWLARRWPDRIHMDWSEFEHEERLEALLPLLIHPAEGPGVDEVAFTLREWIARMKSPEETDAAFLLRRFADLPMSDAAREILYDGLDPPLVLRAGADTPSRTAALAPRWRVQLQAGPFARTGRVTQAALDEEPISVRTLSPPEARRMIALAREAMVTRQRDLDVFSYADPREVRLVEYRDGLAFAAMSASPERRLLLESVYGYLTLKNGVPIGYVLTSALFGSSELAYNVFDTYRGAEAGAIYHRVLAMTRFLFGSDTFTIFPYQLGDGNSEALESGAWWFYHKMGFRPRERDAVRLMRRELAAMRRRPKHRSSLATLRRLARSNVYLSLGPDRDDIIGQIELPSVGLAVTRYLAWRFGGEGDRGRRVSSAEAATLLGVRSRRGWSAGERLVWERWAPLVLVLPGVARWKIADQRALVEVIRAKGGVSESAFVRKFDAHRRLRSALRRLAVVEPS